MTDDDYAPIEARAERLGISTSDALRQLLELGALMERYEESGLMVTREVAGILGRQEPVLLSLARDPRDPEHGPLWIVTPEEQAAVDQGADVT